MPFVAWAIRSQLSQVKTELFALIYTAVQAFLSVLPSGGRRSGREMDPRVFAKTLDRALPLVWASNRKCRATPPLEDGHDLIPDNGPGRPAHPP